MAYASPEQKRELLPRLASGFDLGSAGVVRLVDDVDIGDLHDAGFECLDVVAHAGDQDQDGDGGDPGDGDFGLTYADGLDDEDVASRSSEEPDEI